MQPGHEIHIVTYAAADLLGSVHMCVHKTRQNIPAIQFYHFCVRSHHYRINLAYRFDLIIFYEDAASVIYSFTILSHGDYVTVL